MNFDVLSFIFGKLNCGSNFNDVVSYLLGKAVSVVWKTITNVAIASFTTVSTVLRELIVDVTPVQSGSGDPSPDGSNLYDASTNTDGKSIRADGTVSDSPQFWYTALMPVVSGKDYIFAGTSTFAGNNVRIHGYNQNGEWVQQLTVYKTTEAPTYNIVVTIPSGIVNVRVSFNHGDTNNSFYQKGNIRPISGWTGAQIVVSPTLDAQDGTTYVVSWQSEAGTVYGGTLTDNGDGTWTLTVTHGYIASYAGESINEPWISSEDVYSAGTTPTTGAQVVYPLAMSVTYDLTAESVKAILGQNNIFADCGNINTITYRES